MKQYLDLLRHVRQHGVYKEDRTGTGTYSVFGYQMRFNLAEGFPLVTTKKCHLKSIIHELLWFLQGETNIRYLGEHGVSIWDEWVKPGTEEYRPATLLEVNARIKAAGLQEEFIEWVKPYWLSEYKEGYEMIQGKTMHVKDGPDIPGTIYWAHPDYDAMAFAWAEERGVSTKTLIAGELGPVYGYQWRSWPAPNGESIDQIAKLVEMIKKNPDSRRLIVSAWNPALVDQMALPPCHALFQFYSVKLTRQERERIIQPGWDGCYTEYSTWLCDLDEDIQGEELGKLIDAKLDELGVPKRRLSCQLYQRSADIGLGVPFNIASYALLTMMVAQVTNMVPGEFIWTGGDCHIYKNHLEGIDLQLTREPHPLPKMKINPEVKDIFSFTYGDFDLVGYTSDPHISLPVAV